MIWCHCDPCLRLSGLMAAYALMYIGFLLHMLLRLHYATIGRWIGFVLVSFLVSPIVLVLWIWTLVTYGRRIDDG